MPTVQFDGITLIKQHIGITCESDNPEFVLARGEVNDLEGFFCVMTYVRGADSRTMPRFVKISATAFGQDQEGKKLYSEKVIDFEMQLISEIMVETKYAQGIELCNNHRTASIRVFSSSDFKVSFDYGSPEEEGHLVLHQVTPVDARTNEYNMTVQVPVQVSHSFDVILTLSHQYASKPRRLHLKFLADQICQREAKTWGETLSMGFDSSPTPPANQASPPTNPPQAFVAPVETSWMSYLIFFLALLLIVVFILVHFFEIDVGVSKENPHSNTSCFVDSVLVRLIVWKGKASGPFESAASLVAVRSVLEQLEYFRRWDSRLAGLQATAPVP